MNLFEASLARIWDHYKNRQFAVLTSWRQNNSKDMNDVNFKSLKADLRANDIGFIPLIGYGTGDVPGGETVTIEPSLAAFPKTTPNDGFRDIIIDLGKKYKQWGVIIHTSQQASDNLAQAEMFPTELITLNPERVEKVYGSVHFNKIAEFFSELFNKQGRTFTFEKVLAAGRPKGTNSWMAGMARVSDGEIFDDLNRYEESQLNEILKYLGQ
jgi:hypothetical protein